MLLKLACIWWIIFLLLFLKFCFFFFALFHFVFFAFDSLVSMWISEFILLGVHWLSWMSLIFSIIWKPFSHYLFFQLSFLLFSSSETPFLYIWDAIMSHGFLRLYFSSFFFTSFCSSNWIIPVDLFSVCSVVLLISSSEFFIYIIVFLNSIEFLFYSFS